ncbi:MAG: HetP family heterocyst commitment protein, partial [Moorea sp. SIO3C2]|nr:HetP family heterocyst commitment protein [Moorena sp. SIO3C2]
MSTEQLNQVIEAIISGKYSWACVLILRFSGYNP